MNKKIVIYDPPMCCSSGVCGPNPDQPLMDFQNILEEVRKMGVLVERYIITQSPEKFKDNPQIIKLIQEQQLRVLPITTMDGTIVKTGSYPTLEEFKKIILEKSAGKNVLKIKWQRLVSEGQTCPRCGLTEKEVEKAVATLKHSLELLGTEVKLKKEKLSFPEFKKDPSQSNRIWINGRLLEDWIGGKVGHSSCCDVCGSSECRTLETGGEVYEAIPGELIIRAGLIAASELVNKDTNKNQ